MRGKRWLNAQVEFTAKSYHEALCCREGRVLSAFRCLWQEAMCR